MNMAINPKPEETVVVRGQGRNKIRLESWGDPVETVRLYEAIGFRLAEHYLAYRKEL